MQKCLLFSVLQCGTRPCTVGLVVNDLVVFVCVCVCVCVCVSIAIRCDKPFEVPFISTICLAL